MDQVVHPSLSSSPLLILLPPALCPPSLRFLSFSYIKDILTPRGHCSSSFICYPCHLYRAVGQVCNSHNFSSQHITAGFSRRHFYLKTAYILESDSCYDALVNFSSAYFSSFFFLICIFADFLAVTTVLILSSILSSIYSTNDSCSFYSERTERKTEEGLCFFSLHVIASGLLSCRGSKKQRFSPGYVYGLQLQYHFLFLHYRSSN